MKLEEISEKLKGTQTIDSVQRSLSCKRQRAIYIISRLRKAGYVKTERIGENKRLYSISFENKVGGERFTDVINRYSPIKVIESNVHIVFGRKISKEEALVYAINSKSIRLITAALFLFRKELDWNLLYHLAKKENIERKIGALYDVAKKCFRVRKMKPQFKHYAQNKHKFIYVVDGFKTKDFKDIEQVWHTYVPFNKKDILEEIHDWRRTARTALS